MTDATPTEILSEGGFKTIDAQAKRLRASGLRADVVRPPGSDPNS